MLLGQHPEQWELLRDQSDRAAAAFEEVIRGEAPVQSFARLTESETELAGSLIPAGQRVVVLFGAANRDADRWTDADPFDISRKQLPNLGFGHGIHSCAGQYLARVEGQAVFQALARRGLVVRGRRTRVAPEQRAPRAGVTSGEVTPA